MKSYLVLELFGTNFEEVRSTIHCMLCGNMWNFYGRVYVCDGGKSLLESESVYMKLISIILGIRLGLGEE